MPNAIAWGIKGDAFDKRDETVLLGFKTPSPGALKQTVVADSKCRRRGH